MKVARVVGWMTGTEKHPHYGGHRLLVVEYEAPPGLQGGGRVAAVDRIGARQGERVLVVDDGAAARTLLGVAGPIRTLIVGVVDAFEPGPGPG